MTGGGGLFAYFVCFVVATAIARPQECEKAPPWTLNGENPLEQTRGTVTLVALLQTSSHFSQQQALSMESLLLDLRDYGMRDLSFLIVNSEESRYDEMFDRLKSRLSFPMYQETRTEQVLDTMDGSVNDMFVYDRCGRLTYFIPFPLSKFQGKQPVVRAALLSTYFRSPCGLSCGSNEINMMDIQEQNLQEVSNNEQVDEHTEITPHPNGTGMPDIEDDNSLFDNISTSDENEVMDDINYDYYHSLDNSTDNLTPNVNSTENQNITLTKSSPAGKGLFSILVNFLWGDGKSMNSKDVTTNVISQLSTISVANETQMIPNSLSDSNDLSNSNAEPSLMAKNTTILSTTTKDNQNDTCFGIDESICMDWSKNKLIHAQRCCRITMKPNSNQHGKGCKNFGKKRCKKIQPLLKCCLKTELLAPPKKEEPGTM